jgi:predicted aspartyl protease
MILGEFNNKGELIFEVGLIAADGDVIPVNGLLDTGFSDCLAVDNQDAESLGWLRINRPEQMKTARGLAQFNLYQGSVFIDGEEFTIPILGGDEIEDILYRCKLVADKKTSR